MRTFTFEILLKNGDLFRRGEWGKTRKSAEKTIRGVYQGKIERLVALT